MSKWAVFYQGIYDFSTLILEATMKLRKMVSLKHTPPWKAVSTLRRVEWGKAEWVKGVIYPP